jgi:hypothetical protein
MQQTKQLALCCVYYKIDFAFWNSRSEFFANLATSIKQIVTVKNCFCTQFYYPIYLQRRTYIRNRLSSTTVDLSDHRSDQHTQVTKIKIDNWTKKWRIKTNQSKSTRSTFTLSKQTCPRIQMGNITLPPPPPNDAKCAKCRTCIFLEDWHGQSTSKRKGNSSA